VASVGEQQEQIEERAGRAFGEEPGRVIERDRLPPVRREVDGKRGRDAVRPRELDYRDRGLIAGIEQRTARREEGVRGVCGVGGVQPDLVSQSSGKPSLSWSFMTR
jgi:hypothetical protein